MRIITRTKLMNFIAAHEKALGPLMSWETIVKSASWTCSNDVKRTFRNADWVDNRLWVFDASRFRISGSVQYQRVSPQGRVVTGIVYIESVMTHEDYDVWTARLRKKS